MPNHVTFGSAVTGSSFYPSGHLECVKPCSTKQVSIGVSVFALGVIGIVFFVSALEDTPILSRPKDHIVKILLLGVIGGLAVIATIVFVAYSIWQNHKAQLHRPINAVELQAPA